MLRVLFRVDGNLQIGLGHLMRCMALAQSLYDAKHEVVFAVLPATRAFCQQSWTWVERWLEVPDLDPTEESLWLSEQCDALQIDWLLLDGYQFDLPYRNQFINRAFKLGVFDDINSSGTLDVDMVINWAPGAAQLNYSQNTADAALCVGDDYRILRQEFLNLTDRDWHKRPSLLLMFGASDPLNYTLLVLQELERLAVIMPIVVVTGAAYARLEELKHFLARCELDIRHVHDCQNVAEVMRHSRLAISAAGGSQFELLYCATPAILLVLAENQRFASRSAAQQGWCLVVDCEESSVPDLVRTGVELWHQSAELERMHQRAIEQQVPAGASKIIDIMTKQYEANKGLQNLNV